MLSNKPCDLYIRTDDTKQMQWLLDHVPGVIGVIVACPNEKFEEVKLRISKGADFLIWVLRARRFEIARGIER